MWFKRIILKPLINGVSPVLGEELMDEVACMPNPVLVPPFFILMVHAEGEL
jgi:hypothetical protein